MESLGVDTTRLPALATALEVDERGDLWVRASGSLTFEGLCHAFPGHIPYDPPTGDRITLAGALAACSHSAVGYFADRVRAFSLLTDEGRVHRCYRGAPGLPGRLFELVPGSFGALGVILDMELCLRFVTLTERAEMNVLLKGKNQDHTALDRMEDMYKSGEYPLGRGVFLYGRRGTTVLFGDRLVQPDRPEKPLPLTDDATERNIVLQSLAHRFPGVVHRLVPSVMRAGRRFHATPYGFCFYQRSYDRAHDFLSGSGLVPRALRAAGVDPRLTVCHQTFAIPVSRGHDFLDLYFRAFDRSSLETRLEQQDMIRLPPCSWPLHATYGMPGGAYFFSASFSVRRDQASHREAEDFLSRVANEASPLGVKVLLLKQAFCDASVLREMHRPFVDALRTARREVDPDGLLTSRFLAGLGV
jgi:FAD/FMN-containing dehydrogenase